MNSPFKYTNRLIEMIGNDKPAVHLYQNIADGVLISLCGDILPQQMSSIESIGSLRDCGIIDPASLPVFDVFCKTIENGIVNGICDNSLTTEFSIRLSADGEYEMCSVYALFLRDAQDRITDVHYRFCPFTEKQTFTRDVLKMFSSDKNPKLFSQRCKNTIDNNPDKQIAFIQFDVDKFKIINEEYGVQKGDDLLAFISDTLSLVCADNQPYCRLTADIFMVVTPFEEREELLAFVRKLEDMLNGFDGMDYRLTFGISVVEDRTVHTRYHGDNASIARRSIKGNALNNVAFFNSAMKSELEKTKAIEDEMAGALARGEFIMHLQPKYSISTERIIGAEALARWIHPKRGMISPAEFIPVFEKNGFILKLDLHIWELACRKIRSWIDNGVNPVPISVNISREYINSFDIKGTISQLIEKYDVPAHLLELEITESMESVGVEKLVMDLKSAGFTLLMDDFGSGYSSLNTLKSTPFDVLKMDRGFLGEFMESDRGRKIIEHTISMSQDIGLDIVAEGVETCEQAQFLSKCGCDSAQGYYYSKPISEEEFDKKFAEVNG